MVYEYKYVMRHTSQEPLLVAGRFLDVNHPERLVADLVEMVYPKAGMPANIRINPNVKRGFYYWETGVMVLYDNPSLTTVMHETAHHVATQRFGIPKDNGYRPHQSWQFVKTYDAIAEAAFNLGCYNPLTNP